MYAATKTSSGSKSVFDSLFTTTQVNQPSQRNNNRNGSNPGSWGGGGSGMPGGAR